MYNKLRKWENESKYWKYMTLKLMEKVIFKLKRDLMKRTKMERPALKRRAIHRAAVEYIAFEISCSLTTPYDLMSPFWIPFWKVDGFYYTKKFLYSKFLLFLWIQ